MAQSRAIKKYVAKKDKNSAKALGKQLEAEFRALALESEKDLREVARLAERRLLVTAPKGRTLELVGSIEVNPGRDERGFYVTVSVGPFYSSFLEYGTVNIRPRPFFRPAIAVAVNEFQRKK